MAVRAITAEGESGVVVRAFLGRLGFYLFVVVVSGFFALPLLWLDTEDSEGEVFWIAASDL
mgnify:CR=1 FL=1